jgi:hypothetical protein
MVVKGVMLIQTLIHSFHRIHRVKMDFEINSALDKIRKYKKLFTEVIPSLYEIPEQYNRQYSSLIFPPPSLTFDPFDLDTLQVAKDQPLEQRYQFDERYHAIQYDTQLEAKAYIHLWRNVDTGHKLNTLKFSVTNCTKFVSKSCAGKCKECKDVKIGIYRFYGSTAGNVIWLSLREAQHLVHILSEFVNQMTEVYESYDLYDWISKSELFRKSIDTNTQPSPLLFVPTDFSESTLSKDLDQSQQEECDLDYESVLKFRFRNYDRKTWFPSWRSLNSILVQPFSPGCSGPYYVEIYKDYGFNSSNLIYVTIFEAQHLVLKLIELIALGVELHINTSLCPVANK